MSRESKCQGEVIREERLHIKRAEKKARREDALQLEMQKKREKKRADKNRSLRGWLLKLGIPSAFFFAGIALMPAGFFWIGVGAAYIGAVSFLVDWLIFFKGTLIRRLFGASFPVFALLFITYAAFWPLAPSLLVFSDSEHYQDGQTFAGIKWKSNYTAVRLVLTNMSTTDFTDIHGTVAASNFIAGIGFLNTLEHCSATPLILFRDETIKVGNTTIPLGTAEAGPLFTNYFKIQCDRLRKSDDLEMVIAIAAPAVTHLSADLDFQANWHSHEKKYCLKGQC
jgi:hypothetical protein